MFLTYFEINTILTWSVGCVYSSVIGLTKSAIIETKHYVSVVTLSIQYNKKLLQQLKVQSMSNKINNTGTKPMFILLN